MKTIEDLERRKLEKIIKTSRKIFWTSFLIVALILALQHLGQINVRLTLFLDFTLRGIFAACLSLMIISTIRIDVEKKRLKSLEKRKQF